MPYSPDKETNPLALMAEGGDMGRLMRAYDWAQSAVGAPETWPQCLRTALGILMASGYPMYLAWGLDYIQFYNDAYRPLLGTVKHPGALGARAPETFAEIWEFMGPVFRTVRERAEARTFTDQLLALDRQGFTEECYFTFSCSPICADSGEVGGVFVTIHETTERVVRERREQAIRELYAIRTKDGAEAALAAAAEVLGRHRHDLPFCRFEPPPQTQQAMEVHDIAAQAAPPWPEPVRRVATLPIRPPGSSKPAALLVAGLSPRLVFDSRYGAFLEEAANAIGGLIDGAQTLETERRRAETLTDVDRARREAESANRAKDEFMAVLGHELRNPLAPMSVAVHLLRMRGGAGIDRELSIIERQLTHMTRLVDDLLDVSRAASGKINLSREPIEISDIAAAAVEVAGPLLEQRGHQLDVRVPSTGLRVHGDRSRLTQVIANLLTNAAKYTPEGGEVAVAARRDDDDVVISVMDNGDGIAAEQLPRIFESFFQPQQGPDRLQGGLGIGLAIARNLTALHGGNLAVQSDGPGKGSTFTVRLPVLKAVAAAAPQRSAKSALPAGTAAIGRRVLVVDDNRDAASTLAELLMVMGHSVRVAYDGPAALREAQQFTPDVAVLDIGLPVMDGYELAGHLRESPALGTVKLIALTGYGGQADRERSRVAGFLRHLTKPVDLDQLEAAINEIASEAVS